MEKALSRPPLTLGDAVESKALTRKTKGGKTMREIKFRAWDNRPKAKCMLDWFTINQTAFNFNCNTPLLWTVMHDPDIIRLRYTGLKDKNGKDIHEGDIVVSTYGKHYNEPEGITRAGQVVYDDKTASFRISVINSAVLVSFGDTRTKDIQVIGNIYEHPHLLVSPKAIARQHMPNEVEADHDPSST